MSASTSPFWTRVFLALLLPIFVRTTNLNESAIVLLLWTSISLPFMTWTRRGIEGPRLQHILAAALGCFGANYFVDHALRGAWPQLIFAYICSWDALMLLFPAEFSGHWAHINHLRTTDFLALSLQIPLLVTGVSTIYFADNGYLNASAGDLWLVVSAFLVWLAMADILQHATVAALRYGRTSRETEDVKPESSTPAAVDPANEERLGTVKKIPEARELSLEEISDLPLPKEQLRASTRRRG